MIFHVVKWYFTSVGDISRRQANTREISIYFILHRYTFSAVTTFSHGINIYIYVCTKKIVIERTRDLNYLKFVATDFSPKTISPSAGENSGDLA